MNSWDYPWMTTLGRGNKIFWYDYDFCAIPRMLILAFSASCPFAPKDGNLLTFVGIKPGSKVHLVPRGVFGKMVEDSRGILVALVFQPSFNHWSLFFALSWALSHDNKQPDYSWSFVKIQCTCRYMSHLWSHSCVRWAEKTMKFHWFSDGIVRSSCSNILRISIE